MQDQTVFREVAETVRKGCLGQKAAQLIARSGQSGESLLPEFCWLLITRDWQTIQADLIRSKYLFHLHRIAEESAAIAMQFQPPEARASTRGAVRLRKQRRDEMEKRYRLDLAAVLREAFPEDFKSGVEVRQPNEKVKDDRADLYECDLSIRSERSYTTFFSRSRQKPLSDKRNKELDDLFLRYYPVIGRSRFLLDSPRRTVYLHRLGEETMKTAMEVAKQLGPPSTIDRLFTKDAPTSLELTLTKTLYPSLDLAMVNYGGPECRGWFDRLMQSIIFQESLKKRKTVPLKSALLGDAQCLALAQALGRFLGTIHGVTFGFRRHLDQNVLEAPSKELKGTLPQLLSCDPLIKLLVEHLDQIPLLRSKVYARWLAAGAGRPRSFQALLEMERNQSGVVGLEVAKLIRQDDLVLNEIWEELCEQSSRFHEQFGTIGYQGVYVENLYLGVESEQPPLEDENDHGLPIWVFCDQTNIPSVHLADHSGVAIIDPAIEAGTVLAELLSLRMSSGAEAQTMTSFSNRDLNLLLNDRSLPNVRDAFHETYIGTFRHYLVKSPFWDEQEDSQKLLRELAARMLRMAGVSLLARFHDSREYELNDENRNQIVHTCVDLLHAGIHVGLRTREPSLRPEPPD